MRSKTLKINKLISKVTDELKKNIILKIESISVELNFILD